MALCGVTFVCTWTWTSSFLQGEVSSELGGVRGRWQHLVTSVFICLLCRVNLVTVHMLWNALKCVCEPDCLHPQTLSLSMSFPISVFPSPRRSSLSQGTCRNTGAGCAHAHPELWKYHPALGRHKGEVTLPAGAFTRGVSWAQRLQRRWVLELSNPLFMPWWRWCRLCFRCQQAVADHPGAGPSRAKGRTWIFQPQRRARVHAGGDRLTVRPRAGTEEAMNRG